MDEQQLAERAVRGDRQAFAALVRRHQDAVFRTCRRYRAHEAEDLAQETFLRAFVHRERFDAGRPILPWLLTIARRLCIDRTRRHGEIPENAHEVAEHPDVERPDAEREFSTREQLSRLAKAHAKLPEGPREAVALFHWEGLTYDEIAVALEVPMGTVMTWLHRGRAQLKQALAEGDAP